VVDPQACEITERNTSGSSSITAARGSQSPKLSGAYSSTRRLTSYQLFQP